MTRMAVRLGAGFALAEILCLGIVSAAGANHSVTDLVSIGPAGGSGSFPAQSVGSSQDASHVFFTTGESLVAGDTDASTDIYERFGAATTHVSIGPSGGNGAVSATFAAASADGSRVFFTTAEVLAFPDSDNQLDIYERSGGNTTLVSQGTTGGNGTLSVTFHRISADGTRVLFQTLESLVPGDTDSSIDVYERSGGTTTLLSTGPAGGNGAFPVSFGGASQDATRVFFTTSEPLVAGDTDTSQDIYERS
jgi:hypothetical protein